MSTAGLSPSGLTFGPDGRLYAASPATGEVRRYNVSTGAYDVFIPGGGTLSVPVGIAFGPDGNLYVNVLGGPSAGGIDRYDGTTGVFIDHVVPVGRLNAGRDMAFSGGYLYVGEESNDDVLRFDATTGAFDRVFVAAGADWRQAGCSMCLGMNPDQLKPGERSASTSNRNFEGRQGKGGRTHLVSPLVAAATAVRGTLSSPADLR